MPIIRLSIHSAARALVAAVILLVTHGFAAEQGLWQLTFAYDEQHLSLERAAQIPAMSKVVRTPGLDSALMLIDYEMEWLDSKGRTVLTNHVTMPLSGRRMMEDGKHAAHAGEISSEGAFVLRVQGPQDPNWATQVRLSRGRGRNLRNSHGLPSPFTRAGHTFALPPQRATTKNLGPGPISATKVRSSGADENRFVLVIEGDGYTAADLSAGAFSTKVSSFLDIFFATRPWSLYQDLVNVYRLDIESAESGADYEDGPPDGGGTLKDTYLNTSFWVGGVSQCFYVTGNGQSRAMAAADELVGVGVWDQILVFGNSPTYGGCGSTLGVTSSNSQADEMQLHELGHSFASLADEYDSGGSGTDCLELGAPNVDCSDRFPSVKWDAWVTPNTPIPTDNPWDHPDEVGAFEGAAYQALGLFRPMLDCRMRTLGEKFCPVCIEAHIVALFSRLSMIESANPPFGPTQIASVGTRAFSVNPAGTGLYNYRWFLGDALLSSATNSSVSLSRNQVTTPGTKLRLEVTHLSTNVRSSTLVQSNFVWSLHVEGKPALGIERIRSEGTDTLIFSFPNDATLQESETVSGPWRDVLPIPASPYMITSPRNSGFYRLRVP